MATIKIERADHFVNMIRDYRIYIDGEKAGTIASGQTKEFTAAPGKHSLIAKIDWCSSPEISFNLAEDETKIIQVGSAKYIRWVWATWIGVCIILLVAQRRFDFNWKYAFIFPYAFPFLFLYIFILARKKYLTLVEI